MTVITPGPPATAEQVKALLAEGKTAAEAAEQARWPRSRVIALVNGTKGWLLDPVTDRVYEPGRRTPVAVPTAEFREPSAAAAASDRAPAAAAEPPESAESVGLPIHAIEPHPANIRDGLGDSDNLDELAASMRAHGVLQPLVVYPHPESPGRYRILAGHRRHAAAQLAGLTKVPVVIRDRPADPGTAVEVMLIENLQRVNLGPVEKAEAFAKLRDLGYSQARIAERTGITQSTVGYFLSLMELDGQSRDLIRHGELKVGDAVAAVRKARAQAVKKAGGRPADHTWEPDYLCKTHPLAKRAKALCDARDHGLRRRIGHTACGQCWETAIRQDEGTVLRATLAQDNAS